MNPPSQSGYCADLRYTINHFVNARFLLTPRAGLEYCAAASEKTLMASPQCGDGRDPPVAAKRIRLSVRTRGFSLFRGGSRLPAFATRVSRKWPRVRNT